MAGTPMPRKKEALQSVRSRTKLTLTISSQSCNTLLASRDCSWGLCIKSRDRRDLALAAGASPPPRMTINAELWGRNGWRMPAGIGIMRCRGVFAPVEAIALTNRCMACGHKEPSGSLLKGGGTAAEVTLSSTSDRTRGTEFTDETSGAQHALNSILHVRSHQNYNHHP